MKPQKAKKLWKIKEGTKNKEEIENSNKCGSNYSPTISIITLNISGLNAPKIETVTLDQKNKTQTSLVWLSGLSAGLQIKGSLV